MQFIANGPDIPDALLQAHEEGRVVFFCGAGISYPAGLPGFKELVEEIYRLTDARFTDIERKFFKREQFDSTLDQLERRLPGQRLKVRRALAKALKPKLRRKGAMDTHVALLRLARNRKNTLKLVTTNFDRVFHAAAKHMRQPFQAYAAPMLPIPKDSRWNGLVYLHGLLPENLDSADLNRLVVTSGDFGLAYLSERWAARFVSELFHNYVVCFVGYSINDTVLRYMMDALAADRMLGEVTPQAWALVGCEPEEEKCITKEWVAKGVTPILYHVSAKDHNHSAMHETLHAWAETWRDGVSGKEHIIVSHALARPSASTQQDDFVSRVIWALSDKSGLPAKCFAECNPVPPLEWLLEAFADDRYRYCDLVRFGVPPHAKVDDNLRFSLINRPAPYDRAPHMLLASFSDCSSQWDDVMNFLARWLLRHLGDPRLILWAVQCGGRIHKRWSSLIENKLDSIAELERNGKIAELDAIRIQAPNAIPNPLMRTLWRLLLTGRVKTSKNQFDLYQWKKRLDRDGLTTILHLELRELLAPQVILEKSYHLGDEQDNLDASSNLQQPIRWEFVLATDYVHSILCECNDKTWKSALPQLLEDFQQLLHDALDLQRELWDADDHRDRSSCELPSISPHWQNRGFCDWVSLIELLRDAWLALRANDNARARRIAQNWFEVPYPTFKRLALFAASHDNCIPPEQWVDWLLAEDASWLWNMDVGREAFRLLVLQGRQLTGAAHKRLEAAILAGPPCEKNHDDLELEQSRRLEHAIWLHLAKLKVSGLILKTAAQTRLDELTTKNPEWQLADNGNDEFVFWMTGTGDPDYEESQEVDIAPRKRLEIVQWLRKSPSQRHHKDTWRSTCRKHLLNTIYALCDLASDNVWPDRRWAEALQVWSEERLALRSWQYAAPLIQKMPDDVLMKISHGVTWWMETVSKSINQHEEILQNLCHRILALPLDSDTGISLNPVTEAINHPVGHVTQVVINLWFTRNPKDGEKLPPDILPFFTKLCKQKVARFRHGRVILASQLIALYRVDIIWTEKYLLPLFDWDNPGEAKALWEGFLWSPRLYLPLLLAFKSHFLECANHFVDLGTHRQRFAAFLTYVAIGTTEGYTMDEFRTAIGVLPQEGLEECAQALFKALESAADQREDYWKNRVLPFWQHVWPKSRDRITSRIAESLTRLIIAAEGEFPAALVAVRDWLQPIERPHNVVSLLHKSNLCGRFAADALDLLHIVIDNPAFVPIELEACLNEIGKSMPKLQQDPKFQRLHEYLQRQNY